MKRTPFILTAVTVGISALIATSVFAHGSGFGMGQMGQGQHMMQGNMQGNMQGQEHGFGNGSADCQNDQALATPLTLDDVRTKVEQRLEMMSNDRLKVGNVTETDANTITAEIVTVDDSLVRTIQFDKTTGQYKHNQ